MNFVRDCVLLFRVDAIVEHVKRNRGDLSCQIGSYILSESWGVGLTRKIQTEF